MASTSQLHSLDDHLMPRTAVPAVTTLVLIAVVGLLLLSIAL